MVKNLNILTLKLFYFIKAPLKEVRKSIYSSISLVLLIIYLQMIPQKLLGSSDLTKTQTLSIHKTTKIIIVGWNKNFVFTAI